MANGDIPNLPMMPGGTGGGGLREAAAGNRGLGLPNIRTPDEVSASAGTPSPMRQAITQGLFNMGFAQLGVATGSTAAGMAMVQMGEDVVNVLKNRWWAKEAADFQNREAAWYMETITAAQEKLRWTTTPIVGADGKLGIPSGPPNPDGSPPGIISMEDSRVWTIWTQAQAEKAKTLAMTTVQFWNMAQNFRDNPIIRDTVRGVMVTQASFLDALSGNPAQEAFETERDRRMGDETHEADLEAKSAEAARNRASAGLYGEQAAGLRQEREDAVGDISGLAGEIREKYPDQLAAMNEEEENVALDDVVRLMLKRGLIEKQKDDKNDLKAKGLARSLLRRTMTELDSAEGLVTDERAVPFVRAYKEIVKIKTWNRALKELGGLTEEQIEESPHLRIYALKNLNPDRLLADTQAPPEASAEENTEPGYWDVSGQISEISHMLSRGRFTDGSPISDQEREALKKTLDALKEQRWDIEKGAAKKVGRAIANLKDSALSIVHSQEREKLKRERVYLEIGETIQEDEERKQRQGPPKTTSESTE